LRGGNKRIVAKTLSGWIESACATGLIAVSEDQYRTLPS
jgi:hypothetical protein